MRDRIRSYQIKLEIVAPSLFRCQYPSSTRSLSRCNFTESDERKVLEHMISKHNVNICVNCKLEFPSRQEKKKHMERRHSI